MNKQSVKVIKRNDGPAKAPVTVKKKPVKQRSIENTIENWISERRENVDIENRSSRSQLAFWNSDALLAETV